MCIYGKNMDNIKYIWNSTHVNYMSMKNRKDNHAEYV